MQTFPPSEITLPFAGGKYLFKLRAQHIAALQQRRGWKVTLADGSTYVRPKPLGTIWREMSQGDYDPGDCREIVIQGLIGGNAGIDRDGQDVTVSVVRAEDLVSSYFDDWPAEEKWQFSLAVLVATCQGFVPPDAKKDDDGEDKDSGNVTGAGTGSSTSPASSETDRPVD